MSYLRNFKSTEIDAARLGVDQELLTLLYDIGILGLVRSYFTQANEIFEAYKAVKPKSELARMGLGLLAMALPDFKVAAKLFEEEVLKMNPDNDIARAYLGLAQKELGKVDDARKNLDQVIKSNRDQSALALAKAVMEKLE